MCKEMPDIPVNRELDTKTIIGKTEGQGGQDQGVDGPSMDLVSPLSRSVGLGPVDRIRGQCFDLKNTFVKKWQFVCLKTLFLIAKKSS
jgi:hypothetical protein